MFTSLHVLENEIRLFRRTKSPLHLAHAARALITLQADIQTQLKKSNDPADKRASRGAGKTTTGT